MADPSTQHVFEEVYQTGAWHDTVRSGEGSMPELNRGYINLLQQFIRHRGVTRVVDLGCGDWSFSRLIDWSGVSYTGIDIVPSVIEELTAKYGREGVRFVQGDFLTCELPRADLAICKDVLQHLPTPMIIQFLSRLRNFKYAILTNDRRRLQPRSWRRLWLPVDSTEVANSDIRAGDYRPLRLREPPFNLGAVELMRIKMEHSNGPHIKEVLLWRNGEWKS